MTATIGDLIQLSGQRIEQVGEDLDLPNPDNWFWYFEFRTTPHEWYTVYQQIDSNRLEQMNQETPLIQLQPNMNSLNTTVIVLDPGQIRRTQTGTILTMKVADITGSINATYMNPEFGETWKGGDILRMRGAYTSIFQGGLTLSIGRNGECKKFGEFNMQFSESPDISQMALPVGTTDSSKSGSAQNRIPPANPTIGRNRPSF